MDSERSLELLGLTKTATMKEVKSAFRRLAKVHHPDLGGNQEKFKELLAAFEFLEKNHIPSVAGSAADLVVYVGRDKTWTVLVPTNPVASDMTLECRDSPDYHSPEYTPYANRVFVFLKKGEILPTYRRIKLGTRSVDLKLMKDPRSVRKRPR